MRDLRGETGQTALARTDLVEHLQHLLAARCLNAIHPTEDRS